ncbi:uncharacterized protein UMAG_12124 [Mycosarcoma maydis]|uniref:Uncharacterized protein n=1 Tax=Mycosarcoma maydis TaxID=5270 RepID=A0A0D1E581_MYCMD|nr:uncharacterized protein UMAG_12124 [Ustilago maydis 521]KIS71134.1 hypothetical protein UMAG_12124 [Ustilago maydis 521]|eukprot:XP_011387491.1 hypothetical protein UMAG_12124 [Ustilago maydis 521]
MDGIGFIAGLHAATLDDQGYRSVLLKPNKRQSLRTPGSSISEKTRSIVSKGKSLFSLASPASSMSFSTSTKSVASSLASCSEQGHRTSHSATDNIQSSFVAEHASWTKAEQHTLHHDDLAPESSIPLMLFSAPRPMFQLSGQLCKRIRLDPHFDPSWISTFVDNSYLFPSKPNVREPYGCEYVCLACHHTHLASETLQGSVNLTGHEAAPCITPLSPMSAMLFSIAEQPTSSTDEQPHRQDAPVLLTRLPPESRIEAQALQ